MVFLRLEKKVGLVKSKWEAMILSAIHSTFYPLLPFTFITLCTRRLLLLTTVNSLLRICETKTISSLLTDGDALLMSSLLRNCTVALSVGDEREIPSFKYWEGHFALWCKLWCFKLNDVRFQSQYELCYFKLSKPINVKVFHAISLFTTKTRNGWYKFLRLKK